MKKFVLLMFLMFLVGCSAKESVTYKNISSVDAYNIIESEEENVIIDVRSEEEYSVGHIKGAINIPLDEIKNSFEQKVENKDALILVYCQSGRRSKEASEIIAQMGYTNVNNFGGLNDWTYEIVKD